MDDEGGGTQMTDTLDTLVIGAGQAGLAAGYHLKQSGLRFALLDGHARVGDSWRNRYDSLTLFTPRRYSALPGLALPGDEWGYAGKDEFADYLEAYAKHFALPVSMNTPIRRLERNDGVFVATTAAGERIQARSAILANGAFQRTAIPAIAGQFAPAVQQLAPESYKNAAQVAPGTVLVVGDGASGRDIASDLANTHTVLLATGRARRVLPERVLGKSIWWWLDTLGVLGVSAQSRLGRFIRKADPFPARGKQHAQLEQRGVRVVGRLNGVEQKTVTFAGGITAEVDAVIWAVGYRDEADWIAIPEAKDRRGSILHREGVAPVAGLYYIGRPWQRNRASALIAGVGADAGQVVEQLVRDHAGAPAGAAQLAGHALL